MICSMHFLLGLLPNGLALITPSLEIKKEQNSSMIKWLMFLSRTIKEPSAIKEKLTAATSPLLRK